MLKNGRLFPLKGNLAMISHHLRVSAVALGRSIKATEALSSSAYELWDDYTDRPLHQACSSDPLLLHSPQPPAAEAGRTAGCHDASCTTTPWNTTRRWDNGWTHNDSWAAQASRDVTSGPLTGT